MERKTIKGRRRCTHKHELQPNPSEQGSRAPPHEPTSEDMLEFSLQVDAHSTPKKQRKVEESKLSVKALAHPQFTNPVSKETFTQKALRMGEILQEIFSHLPTNSLLASCSLVNKIWNSEARIFIRDHRICSFNQTRFHRAETCEMLRKLGEICEEMRRNGRMIPFNCLQVNFSSCSLDDLDTIDFPFPDVTFAEADSGSNVEISGPCGNNYSMNNKSLTSSSVTGEGFQPKFIEISGRSCPYHKPLATLLTRGATQLQSLRIQSAYWIGNFRTKQWHPEFPRLEDFSIAYAYFPEGCEETHKNIIRWMLKNAPNLKRIHAENLDLLRIVPEEMLSHVELQDFIDICLNKRQDIEVLGKISQIRPGLRHVRVLEPRACILVDLSTAEPVDAELRQSFYLQLERILQKHHQSLGILELIGTCPLARLSHPPLSNLSKLSISKWLEETLLDKLWEVIASIDFEQTMPKLREVEINIKGSGNGDQVFYNVWPVANSNREVIYVSTSAYKLTLDLHIRQINLRPFQALFPNISVLHLHLNGGNHGSDGTWDFGPVQEIWECWPRLEELKFFGTNNFLNRNYDMDFCGIHEQEAEMLMRKGRKFLKSFHVVPIKPCLLTMPNLQQLWFDGNFFAGRSRHTFLSKLTHFLVFDRKPLLDVTLPKNSQSAFLDKNETVRH